MKIDRGERTDGVGESLLRAIMTPFLRVKPTDQDSIRQASTKWGVDEAEWNEIVQADKRLAPSLRALFPKMPTKVDGEGR
jgi:hypothetical protein